MTFDPNHEEPLRELQQELHRAHTITPGLMADVIARACPRLQSQHRSAKARVIRLIESGAFADATLALLELELTSATLLALTAVFCANTAAMRREAIFGRALTHWDEAAIYAVVGHVVWAIV